MNQENIKKAIKLAKEQAKQRKFSQSFDLIINLKNINIKSNPVNFFVAMPFPKGRPIKVAAFVGQELKEQAQKHCDLTISVDDFQSYKGKIKEIKKLAESYDYFLAQATVMPKMAAVFGKTLGMKGKMPNPKAGQVLAPNANVEPIMKRLTNTVRLTSKKATNLQCIVGKENMPDDQIIQNIESVYKATVKALPNEEQNIKKVMLKLTMGKPVTL